MTNFMAALARFYPCPWCADDFQKHLKQEPVRYVGGVYCVDQYSAET